MNNPHNNRLWLLPIALHCLAAAHGQTPGNLEVQQYSGLTITGVVGRVYQIQYATEIKNPTDWRTLTNVVLTHSPYVCFDFESPRAAQRFYRTVLCTNDCEINMVGQPGPGQIWVGTTLYTDLVKACRHLESGSTLLLGPGTYPISPFVRGWSWADQIAPMMLANLTNVTVAGVGGTVIEADALGHMACIENCTNITFRDLTFQGYRQWPNVLTKGDYMAMVLLRHTNAYLNFFNCRFLDGPQHGIGQLWWEKVSSFVSIRDCQFYNIGCSNVLGWGPDGTAISGIGSYWTVANNRFIQCLRDVEIETYDYPNSRITGVKALGNVHWGTIQACYMIWPANGVPEGITDVSIQGNTISNMVYGTGWTGTGTNHCPAGFNVTGGERLTIANNVISGIGDAQGLSGFGIYLRCDFVGAKDVIIKGNVFHHIDGSAIQAMTCPGKAALSGVMIAHNVISLTDIRAMGFSAIRCAFTRGCIANNLLEDVCRANLPYSAGIELLEGSSWIDISGNRITDPSMPRTMSYGIRLKPGTSNVNCSLNTIQSKVGEVSDGGLNNTNRPSQFVTVTAALDFGGIAAGGHEDLTIAVRGACPDATVIPLLPGNPTAGLTFSLFCGNSNSLTVRAYNHGNLPVDPRAAIYSAVLETN